MIAGLYLASAIAQPKTGRLADLFGARRVYRISLVLVAAAGLLGRLAPTLSMLMVARILLGVLTLQQCDSSACSPIDLGLNRRAPRFSFLSLAALSSAATGPLLGGILTGAFGWHSIFLVNVPLALIAVCLVLLWTPKDDARPADSRGMFRELDLLGIVLFEVFLLCLMIFLMNLTRPIW